MNGSITGLSANALEYVLLALAVLYPIAAFYAHRTGSTLAGKALDLVLKGLPFLEGWVRRERDKAKATEARPAEPTDKPQP